MDKITTVAFLGTYPNTECHPKQPEWRSPHNTGSLRHSPAVTTQVITVSVRSGGDKHDVTI